ncbi:MAG: peptide deformylase [Candidatus Eisenbacteria bacterium]|nr:peptide deformylase [Candidatus Eisenbacteria bacterium]
MAVLPTVKHGHPVLAGRVKPVEEITGEVLELIDDMIETMRKGQTTGVGLAAPQVGRSLAVVVAEPPPEHSGTEALYDGAVVLINPEIVFAKGHTIVEEGCLSCPGVTAEIERPSHIIIKGLDRDGNPVKLEVEGALARIFQHEVDHLHGRFFFDHLNPLKRQLVKARIRRT